MHEQVATLLKEWGAAYQQAARANEYAWLLDKSIFQRSLPDDRQAYGEEVLEDIIWTVSLVLSYRYLDRQVEDQDLDWTRRFLELQRHGLSDEERGARYEVALVGGLDVPLYLDRLEDLDFDDLRGGTEYGSIVIVDHRVEALSQEQAETIARTIHEDLNGDDTVDTYWQHGQNIVLLSLGDEEAESDKGGQLTHAGPLTIEE